MPSGQVCFRMAYAFFQMNERMVVFFNGTTDSLVEGKRKKETHRRAYCSCDTQTCIVCVCNPLWSCVYNYLRIVDLHVVDIYIRYGLSWFQQRKLLYELMNLHEVDVPMTFQGHGTVRKAWTWDSLCNCGEPRGLHVPTDLWPWRP